ncbi:hypothetical protein M3Y99_01208500 [Aphelenchoides fujianensis]|nr:hypothetical protein M3Y99_01208500 [Aphelenchoides fujianensis]
MAAAHWSNGVYGSENVRTYSKGFLFVQGEGVNLEKNGAIFCGGRSLRNDADDGHFWTTVAFEKRGVVRNFQIKLPPVGAEGAELGEYRSPTTSTSTTSIPTTTTSTSTTISTITPPPQVIVKGAFECFGKVGPGLGTVIVFNRRTDENGRRVLEFCGSQELLPDGTLDMKAGGTSEAGEVFYLMRALDESEWVAKLVDLGKVELLDAMAREACTGTLASTLVSTKTVEKCTADDPLVDALDDFVGQTL